MRSRFRAGWMLIAFLLMAIVAQASAPAVGAADLQQQLQEAQQKLEEISRQKQKAQNELATVTLEAEAAEVELQIVENQLVQANNQLAVITEQLDATLQELERVEAELAETQKRYEARKELLGVRIRALREHGPVDYLAVLFGAASFRDFVGRVDRLNQIVMKDKELFEGVKADKLALEKKQEEVQARKRDLEVRRAEAEQLRNTIAAKREERERVSRSLQESRRRLQAQLAEYDSHTAALTQTIAELVRQMNRQGGSFAPIPPVRPVLITDPYGMREHPILGGQRMHWGTDFAARMGQPVYAIEDGVVIAATWDNAFGNLVIIDHGGGITSWYAHNSRILVSVNEAVTQGQQIAEAGSTGWSTGPHVHLEIHVNGERKDPMSFISY